MIIIHIHGVMLVDMDIVIRREFKTTDLMEQCWLAIFILIMNILIDLAHDGQTSIYMVFVENGKGFVDAYRRRSNGGYQLTENIYEIKGYKPYTPW